MNLVSSYQNPPLNRNKLCEKKTYEFLNEIKSVSKKLDALDKAAPKREQFGEIAFEALSPISPVRRLAPAESKIEKKDYFGLTGVLALTGILLPEDIRDLKNAISQISDKILPEKTKEKLNEKLPKFYSKFLKYEKLYDYKEYQVPFSFIRGSYLEPLVNKMGKYGYLAHKYDLALLDTKLGKWIAKKLGVSVDEKQIFTERRAEKVIFYKGKYIVKAQKVFANKLEGTTVAKFLCRIMQRITVYGLAAIAIISLPFILKSDNKQLEAQSALISIFNTVGCIGLFGTLLSRFGPAGSLAGMGYGSVIAKRINEK